MNMSDKKKKKIFFPQENYFQNIYTDPTMNPLPWWPTTTTTSTITYLYCILINVLLFFL